MNKSYTGRCQCGAVSYQCTAEPAFSWNCHCRDCQRASGGAFCPVLYVPRSALTVSGFCKYYEVNAESGRKVSRGFCSECGSPLFIQAELVPDLQGLWAASLDDPGVFQPQVQVWTDRAQHWDNMANSLMKIREAPDAEQFQKLLALSGTAL